MDVLHGEIMAKMMTHKLLTGVPIMMIMMDLMLMEMDLSMVLMNYGKYQNPLVISDLMVLMELLTRVKVTVNGMVIIK